jgi:Protein of unknown function (DUF2637)
MTTQTEVTQKNHRRAVRFFWGLLIGATLVSLTGNVTHALLPYIPHVAIQIGTAAVPPVALLAAVHGIALAVRAGASGRVYCWAVGAVAVIGLGAFAVSFLALRDLMRASGYSSATAWVFPAIIDTAVAVSTLMLVVLGDKPPRRIRTGAVSAATASPTLRRLVQPPCPVAKGQDRGPAAGGARVPKSGPVQPHPQRTVQASAQTEAVPGDADVVRADADFASALIASGVTTQPIETVIAVLEAHRNGASINAAAKASGINYRTAQRIVEAAVEHRQQTLLAVG